MLVEGLFNGVKAGHDQVHFTNSTVNPNVVLLGGTSKSPLKESSRVSKVIKTENADVQESLFYSGFLLMKFIQRKLTSEVFFLYIYI